MRMRSLRWDADAWDDYIYWQSQDKKTLKRINELIKNMLRGPFAGLGDPEALKGDLSGFWSRRINEKDRIIYAIEDNTIIIISCKGHYEM